MALHFFSGCFLHLLWVFSGWEKLALLCLQPHASGHAIFFHFHFLPVFSWAHSGPSVLMALSIGGADLLFFLTLCLPSPHLVISGEIAAALLSCSPAVSLLLRHTEFALTYLLHEKDWASCSETLHPTFWGLFSFHRILTVFLWLITVVGLPGPHLCFRWGPCFPIRCVKLVCNFSSSQWDFKTPPCAIFVNFMKTEMSLSIPPNGEVRFC